MISLGINSELIIAIILNEIVNMIIKSQERINQLLNKVELDFYDTLSLASDLTLDIKDVNDDLNRELQFYNLALKITNVAQSTFQKDQKHFKRPMDYFAEMVKSDKHMNKIKKILINKKIELENIEKAKLNRINKSSYFIIILTKSN